MFRVLIIPVLCGLLLVSCGHVQRLANSLGGESDPFRPGDVPAHLKPTPDGPAPLPRVRVDGVAGPLPVGELPDDDDIVWTNPDDPDAPLEGFEEVLLSSSQQDGGWGPSYFEGARQAVREGKPMLMWFTDTQRSPLCRSLSAEVFSDFAFEEWAVDRLVRVRIDFNVKADGEDDRLRKKGYLAKLKKRYKVRGLPTVLILASDGTVTGRYQGYTRGGGEFYWGKLKNATLTAEEQTRSWKLRMEKKGYRVWKNRKDMQLFARLLRYSEGELRLVEPSGKQIVAKEESLSDEDQAWIRAELAKRGR